MRLAQLAIQVSIALQVIACGGQPPRAARVTSAFTEAHSRLFDDGIDFVQDPASLGGTWHEEWERELDERVASADLIATVHVDTMSTDTDPEQRLTYRILCSIEAEIFGEPPEASLQFSSHEGSPGFSNLRTNEARVLDGTFLVFVKWYQTTTGDVRGHFHLSPASDDLVALVRDRATRRGHTLRDGTRVIVREN